MRPDSQDHQVSFLLECIECGARSAGACGWKAYLDEQTSDVWIYCAECARCEFEAG